MHLTGINILQLLQYQPTDISVPLFVLLQARAASDLKALAKLIPTNSRLVLDPEDGSGVDSSHVREGVEMMMVPTSSVRPGDILRVLPGKHSGTKLLCVLCGNGRSYYSVCRVQGHGLALLL